MKLKKITIALTDQHRVKVMGPYTATAEVEGGSYYDNISISIDAEHCAQIVDIIAAAVAGSMKRAADEFSADLQARIGGAVIEQPKVRFDDGPTAA